MTRANHCTLQPLNAKQLQIGNFFWFVETFKRGFEAQKSCLYLARACKSGSDIFYKKINRRKCFYLFVSKNGFLDKFKPKFLTLSIAGKTVASYNRTHQRTHQVFTRIIRSIKVCKNNLIQRPLLFYFSN